MGVIIITCFMGLLDQSRSWKDRKGILQRLPQKNIQKEGTIYMVWAELKKHRGWSGLGPARTENREPSFLPRLEGQGRESRLQRPMRTRVSEVLLLVPPDVQPWLAPWQGHSPLPGTSHCQEAPQDWRARVVQPEEVSFLGCRACQRKLEVG